MLVEEGRNSARGNVCGPTLGRGVVEAVAKVMNVVAVAQGGIGITDLARGAGLPKSTAHRLAGQLTDSGLLERIDGQYYIGATVNRWSRSRLPPQALQQAAAAPVRRLALLTQALVGLVSVADGLPEIVTSCSADGLPVTIDLGNNMWRSSAAGQLLCGARAVGRSEPRAIVRDEREHPSGISSIAGELHIAGLNSRNALCIWYSRPTLPAVSTAQLIDTLCVIERTCQASHLEPQRN